MSRAEESKGEGEEKGGGWWKSGGNYIKPCGGGGRWSGWFESGAEEGKDGTRAKERRRKVLAPPMRESASRTKMDSIFISAVNPLSPFVRASFDSPSLTHTHTHTRALALCAQSLLSFRTLLP